MFSSDSRVAMLIPLVGSALLSSSKNLDIYLPVWLARHNQLIFGTLYLGATLLALVLSSSP
jgi:uncharacterized membrane protein AbrB (regulator of aidB expression)